MKAKYKKGGYSAHTANEYIDSTKPIYLLSEKLDAQVRFDNGKPTEDIISYKAWFSQAGLPPFSVKFEYEIGLPDYMSIITFEVLKACEVNYNVYFKADGLKEVS
ncbi:TPA: hypothetical protein ACGO35_000326 [Streptococcus suis]